MSDMPSAEIDAIVAALHAAADDMPPGDYRAGWSDALDEVTARIRAANPGKLHDLDDVAAEFGVDLRVRDTRPIPPEVGE